jgi:putative ABC transport system permease protein
VLQATLALGIVNLFAAGLLQSRLAPLMSIPERTRMTPLASVAHALRMTRRDWRAGELRFLLAALAIAVAALSAVGFFVDRMNRALTQDAAQLLGADLVVRADHPVRPEWRAHADGLGLMLADTVSFPSMATTGSGEQADSRLVAVKAVSATYPLRGQLTLRQGAGEYPARGAPAAGTVWVDSAFLSARKLAIGDALTLGEREFKIVAEIIMEKDRGAGFMSFSPRVMLALDDLASTGLVQNGSRLAYRLQVAGATADVAAFRQWLEQRIEAGDVRGVQLESLEAGRPEMRTTLERARQFLALVGLLTAMLAALAIAMAARRFMQRHLDAVAMLRCLGLTQSEVTRIYLIEFALVGLAGGLLGALAGFGAHHLLLQWLGSLLTVPLPPPGWLPLVQGIMTGLLLLLGFAVPPVLQLRNVPHNRVIRREQQPPQPFTLGGYLLALSCFVALLVWQAGDIKLGLLTSAGFAGGLAVSSLLAWAVLQVLRRVRIPLHLPAWRFAQSSLSRRPASSALQIVALSLGLMALLLLTLVRQDLLAAWRQATPENAPNHFIINIQPEQRAPLTEAMDEAGIREANLFPMIRGRLIEVDGRSIGSDSYREDRAQRLVEREFNLSTMAELPAQNSVVEGRWFSGDGAEASIEQGLAKTLGLKLGDTLRFDVAGVPVDAKITSVRKLDWSSMRVNFFVILSPSVAESLPSSWITAFHLPPQQQGLVNRLIRDYPNLTIVDVGSMIAQVQQVIDQVVAAVEFLFLFTLVAGVMVLAAAMLVSQQERAHEAGLLRALGATRAQLSRAQWVECLLVGGSAGALAATGAALVGWILAHQVFEFEWTLTPMIWLAGIALGMVCALAGGWFGLKNVLSRPPILTLREG